MYNYAPQINVCNYTPFCFAQGQNTISGFGSKVTADPCHLHLTYLGLGCASRALQLG